jgi:hypothetical protein
MLTQAMIAELRELEKKNHGQLRTEDVVEKAKEPTSALHSHPAFEWDLERAANLHWHEAARKVIQVFVGIVRDGPEPRLMRQYVNIRSESDPPAYTSTQKVLVENRSSLVNLVCDRVLSAIRNYPLKEFDPVVSLVNKIRAQQGGDTGKKKAA